jgi:hypothetical protein
LDHNIAIGVLAYNEELHIEKVLNELSELGLQIYVINDGSTDSTNTKLSNYKKRSNIEIIENSKNIGAGSSTLKLLKKAESCGYKYLIKVDGDDQFKIKDIKKIQTLLESDNYDFIKSNRFWNGGIEGQIPNKRYFGNLFATIILQFTSGTNKLYDPLNGLFGINVKVLEIINIKKYPKRYGYPFYFSALAAVSFYRIFQINNIVSYGKQKSNLGSFKMLITLFKLSIHFFKLKIENKRFIGKYQRSAFLDSFFIYSLIATVIVIFRFLLIFTSYNLFNSSYIGSWALISIILGLFTIFIFVEAFKEEKAIRTEYIQNEE